MSETQERPNDAAERESRAPATPPGNDNAAQAAKPDAEPSDEGEGGQSDGGKKPEPFYVTRMRSMARSNSRLQSQNDRLSARLEDLERRVGGSGQENASPEPAQRQQPAAQQPASRRQEPADDGFGRAVDAIVSNGTASHADWAEVTKGWANAGFDASDAAHRDLAAYVASLPNPGATWYALAKDPDFAAELLEMSPRQQSAALARFSSGVTTATAAEAGQPPTPVRTQAPPPARPVAAPRGQSTGTSRNLLDPKMPQDDFDAAMRKILRR